MTVHGGPGLLDRRLTKLAVGGIADIVVPKSTDRAGFLAEAASGAFDGCLVAYRTFGSVSITGRIDPDLVLALPPSLKYICHNGAGFDQIVGRANIHPLHPSTPLSSPPLLRKQEGVGRGGARREDHTSEAC